MGLAAYGRLVRAGYILAREGAFSVVDPALLPASARLAISAARLIERRSVRRTGRAERLSRALNKLGPTYVKFGQLLATRPDIVGAAIAEDLSALQDAMDPFDPRRVPGILKAALGERAEEITELSEPIAAASIAQVHRAVLVTASGRQTVAVKLLRPGVAARFARDLESYFAGARLAERLVPKMRRLKPVEVVETLAHSARIELDLRLEAASISEFLENTSKDKGFRAPEVHWTYTAENVLVTSWIDGMPIRDRKALDAAGVDRKRLARDLMQHFLRHAIRDGFFHADMHPGNLFVDRGDGGIVAVDFGIMGRIGPEERRFLADVLYGFISRDYRRIAERHFAIGYVPKDQSVDDFTLALRSIGEPLHGRTASDISMAKVLGQLFAVTELFHMQTRPELLLLQKTMVLVEGVSRTLDPDLDMWNTAEPVVGEWLRREAGPIGRIEDAGDQLRRIGNALLRVPTLIERFETALDAAEAERKKPVPSLMPRWMSVTSFWLFALLALVLLYRLVA
ncbi:MAG TPA: 2-polyprenylphenol 6-hydroxylase [Devosiaceae bacterium]